MVHAADVGVTLLIVLPPRFHMARAKSSNSATAPKSRKARVAVEKVFVVDEKRLVAGTTQRKVEAAVWKKPTVRLASPADLKQLWSRGVEIESIETAPPAQTRVPDPAPPVAATDGVAESALS